MLLLIILMMTLTVGFGGLVWCYDYINIQTHMRHVPTASVSFISKETYMRSLDYEMKLMSEEICLNLGLDSPYNEPLFKVTEDGVLDCKRGIILTNIEDIIAITTRAA